jgi:N-acetylmuramoyl-L-alanine amidase|tara:strand:- start:524 stop:1663 length:1140 start_codon:yes stop_codon:yes gene_type:complete
LKNYCWIILLIFTGFIFVFQPLYAQKGSKIKTVVIDAGHGGKDPGASSKYAREKDIVLSVALKTGGYIKKNFPNVKVIYTRSTDKFIPLHKRGEIANSNNADLFISIHCNANPSSKIYGTETYVLGIEDNRTKRNMDVAMKENAAILLEEDAADRYDNFDPNSPESLISLTLFQGDKLDKSLVVAEKIQRQFSERAGRKDRSVHQAGFLVLWKTSMPSVLVELGYLSNPKEEKFLRSKEGQVYLASAIYRAFKEYKKEFEKENNAYEYRKKALKVEPKDIKSESSKEPVAINVVIYRVQFYASPKKLPLSHPKFKDIEDISYYVHNGMYKYTSGSFSNQNQAITHKKKIRSSGFSDAFVVCFNKSKRISLKEAKLLEKK